MLVYQRVSGAEDRHKAINQRNVDIEPFQQPKIAIQATKLAFCQRPKIANTNHQWESQDPEMEVLYYVRAYFLGIFLYIGLIYGRYLQFRILEFPLKPCSKLSQENRGFNPRNCHVGKLADRINPKLRKNPPVLC